MSLASFFPIFAPQNPFIASEPKFRSARTRAISRTIVIDLQETDASYIIKADLPGFKKDQIKLNVENSINGSNVYISAKRHVAKEEDELPYSIRDRMHQNVRRTVYLPMKIDPDKIDAKMSDGVLYLYIPKSPNVQLKKITIK